MQHFPSSASDSCAQCRRMGVLSGHLVSGRVELGPQWPNAPLPVEGQVVCTGNIDILKAGNERYLEGGLRIKGCGDALHRAAITKGQAPPIAVLGCADSRVPPELIFDAEFMGLAHCSDGRRFVSVGRRSLCW